MRIHLSRLLAVPGIAVALAGVITSPAAAVPSSDGSTQVVALAGAGGTTEDLMNALTAAYNNNATFNPGPNPDVAVNIPVLADPSDSTAFTVPGQGNCPTRTYVNGSRADNQNTFPAPNGAQQGIDALHGLPPSPADNLSTACIDIAGSDVPTSVDDPPGFKYFAYALDAVSWAAYQGGAAPATLSVPQIRAIYECVFTNWSQVGGANAPIHRYLPQVGSGVRDYFVDELLGDIPPSTSCGPVTTIKENDATAVPASDRADAILPFPVSQWVAQANGVIPDKRGGTNGDTGAQVFIGQLPSLVTGDPENLVSGPDADGKFAPNPAVIREFPDIRGTNLILNILDSDMQSQNAAAAASYGAALRFAGTDAGGDGYLCSGSPQVTSILTTYGFQPLPLDRNTNSHCIAF